MTWLLQMFFSFLSCTCSTSLFSEVHNTTHLTVLLPWDNLSVWCAQKVYSSQYMLLWALHINENHELFVSITHMKVIYWERGKEPRACELWAGLCFNFWFGAKCRRSSDHKDLSLMPQGSSDLLMSSLLFIYFVVQKSWQWEHMASLQCTTSRSLSTLAVLRTKRADVPRNPVFTLSYCRSWV